MSAEVDRLKADNTSLEKSTATSQKSLSELWKQAEAERNEARDQQKALEAKLKRCTEEMASHRDAASLQQATASHLQSELESTSKSLTAAEKRVQDLEKKLHESQHENEALTASQQANTLQSQQAESTAKSLRSENEQLKKAVEGNAATVEDLTKAITDLQLQLGQKSSGEAMHAELA